MWAKQLFCGIVLTFNASASVILFAGNHPQPGLENVLLYRASAPGQSIIGHTNSTNTLVDFSTLNGDLLIDDSKGQSYLTAASRGTIRDFRIELANGDPFTSLVLALNLPGVGHASTCFGCISYSATGSAAGTGKLPGALGSGTTFFTFVAPTGEELTSVTLSVVAGEGIENIRQVRISPATANDEMATSEPGTFMLVCGGGLVALGLARRRRDRTT